MPNSLARGPVDDMIELADIRQEQQIMLTLRSPCEPPAHSIWHLVSGVVALAVLWTIGVIAWHWLMA